MIIRKIALLLFFVGSLQAQSGGQVMRVDTTQAPAIAPADPNGPGMPTDAELMVRLSSLSGSVEMRVTEVVKSYINGYTKVRSEKASTMLGRRLTYFPLFEEKLRAHQLPVDLKYLAVVESALNPKAVSRVGATGLWQFMPATGSEYGLRTNAAVEDRSNPVKSTEAAVRYLKDLYRQFNDWALALAAYNSGPGRVNSAIRKAGSRNFWSVMRFLPQETRNYVPAFIAATYICNFYQTHGLQAILPDMDEQLTGHLVVYEGLSFQAIADATGANYQVIKNLNPGFKRDYIPPSTEGHFVVMPQRLMPVFVRYLNNIGTRAYGLENADYYVNSNLGDGRYWKATTRSFHTENIDDLGYKFGVCGDHIKCWNNLSDNFVQSGKEIVLWRPVYVQKHSGGKIEVPSPGKSHPAAKVVTHATRGVPSGAPPAVASKPPPAEIKPTQYQYHTIRRNESLEDVARHYATSPEHIILLNGKQPIRVGARLKIRPL